jgi:hypothetical protein
LSSWLAVEQLEVKKVVLPVVVLEREMVQEAVV